MKASKIKSHFGKAEPLDVYTHIQFFVMLSPITYKTDKSFNIFWLGFFSLTPLGLILLYCLGV